MSDIFKNIEKKFPLNYLVDVRIIDTYTGGVVDEFSGTVTAIMRSYDGFKIIIDCPDKDDDVAVASEFVTLNKMYHRNEMINRLLD